jgi:DNA-binding NtrC family response regulator
MRAARILLVEDNTSLRRGIARALGGSFGEVDQLSKGDEAVERLRDRGVEAYDVVVTDLRLPGASGIEVLRTARERDARTAVVLMTAYGSIQTAVEAMKLGAFDFVQKPFELEELEARVAKACSHARLVDEVAGLRQERAERLGAPRIVGTSESLRDALDLARRVAPTRSTVLVTGETGTGKELIAGVIHSNSPRAGAPFVKVNCAALPETLLESELFGHERGAFTSADRLRIGRFEQADRGTLFLDEIGDMSPATQAKLLRVLQDQQFHRLGGTKALRTDVRIVVATNQDLEKAIRVGSFREDLYFRLNVIGIRLAPLRERTEDLEALARHFLAEFSRELGRPRTGFSSQALARIRSHSWPGNVRELRNAIERAVLMSDGERIEADDIGLPEVRSDEGGSGWRPELPLDGVALEQVERAVVLEALQRTGYVQKEAAQLLRVSRRKLNYMIRRMGITHPTWRRNRGDEAAASASEAADPVDPSSIG